MKTKTQTVMWSLLLAVGLSAALPMARAEDGAAEKPQKERREGGPAGRLEAMRQRLGLTDAQVAQLKEIFAAEREELMAKRKELGKDADRQAAREASQAIREKYRSKIESVLTAEQLEKWTKQRERRQGGGPGGGEGKERRGPGGPGGAGGPGEGGEMPPPPPDSEM